MGHYYDIFRKDMIQERVLGLHSQELQALRAREEEELNQLRASSTRKRAWSGFRSTRAWNSWRRSSCGQAQVQHQGLSGEDPEPLAVPGAAGGLPLRLPAGPARRKSQR